MKKLILIVSIIFLTNNQVFAQLIKAQLKEHTANVETVAFSSNGKYFVSSGWDGAVNLYDIDSTGMPIFKYAFMGHLGAVTSLNFSRNNKYIISCGKDYSARLWDIEFPDSSKSFNMHLEPVTNAFLDPSGRVLITCSADGTIRNTSLLDAKKSKIIKVGTPINDLRVSKDYRFYYVALKGTSISKIDAHTAKVIKEFTGHQDEVNAIDISPDGNFMASASNDKTIIIWDLNTGKESKKLTGFEWKVTSVEFSGDGKYIIGGCNEGTTKLFNVETGALVTDFKEVGTSVHDVAFSPNGTYIAVATSLKDTEQYGAVIYVSGVVVEKKVFQPRNAKGKNKYAPRPAVKPNTSR